MKITKAKSNKLPYISYADIAEELDISKRTVAYLVEKKGLRPRYFGKKPCIRIEDIIEELESHKKPVPLEK